MARSHRSSRCPATQGLRLAGAVVALVLAVAACGEETSEVDTEGPAEPTETTESADPSTTVPARSSASAITDACLFGDDDLAPVFGADVPAASSGISGEGFAECEWEGEDRSVLVSVVPEESFRSDYVDQLNLVTDFDGVGLPEGAVAFPGLVGIGRADKGASVGFPFGDQGVIVAVGTVQKPNDETLDVAVELAQKAASGAPEAPAAGGAASAPAGETAAPITDACAVFDDDDLAPVFGDEVPPPEGLRDGGTAFCRWAGEERAVAVAVGPWEELQAAIQAGEIEPIADFDGAGVGLPDGAVAIPGAGDPAFDGRGASVAFPLAAQGASVGLSTAEEFSDATLALVVELARTILAEG